MSDDSKKGRSEKRVRGKRKDTRLNLRRELRLNLRREMKAMCEERGMSLVKFTQPRAIKKRLLLGVESGGPFRRMHHHNLYLMFLSCLLWLENVTSAVS